MMHQLIDNPKYTMFVNPQLCSDLQQLGLTSTTVFQWKIYADRLLLNTHVFDVDDYNSQAMANTDAIDPPLLVLPAYTIMDMQNLIPSYKSVCNQRNYMVTVDRYVRAAITFYSERLPDAMAMVIKELLLQKKVILPIANSCIEYKQLFIS
jgi:hypothetical protein